MSTKSADTRGLDLLARYAHEFNETAEMLTTITNNIEGLLDFSTDGTRNILSLIGYKFDFLVNDMRREIDGKDPMLHIKPEALDFAESCQPKGNTKEVRS